MMEAVGAKSPTRNKWLDRLPVCVSLLVGLGAWQAAAEMADSFVLAPPLAVFTRLVSLIRTGELPIMLGQSLIAFAVGYGLAIAVALPLGFLIGRSRRAYDLIDPTLNAVYAVPTVAFVPLIIVWCGLFLPARVTLVFLMCVFDMLVVVAAGARDVERRYLDVGRSFGATTMQQSLKVLLPASMPFTFTALRLGAVRAVNGMITAELFFAAVNLGGYMEDAGSRFDTAGVMAVLVVLCLTGLAIQAGIRWLQTVLLPWHAGERA